MSESQRPYKKVKLKNTDLVSISESMYDLGYHVEDDYKIAYGLTSLTTKVGLKLDVSMFIYNEKMLQDPRIREMFLEHLI